MTEEEKILSERGVSPTANRILILRALRNATNPLSMSELETELETVDKSVIFRNLNVFRAHHLLHQVLAGEEVKYEFCRHDIDEGGVDDDEHVHFYCQNCHRLICMYELPIPHVEFPQGYAVSEVNYVASGLCPQCAAKLRR